MATETAESHGIDAVVDWLRDRRVDFDVVDHPDTASAVQEANASGIEPDHAAKTMVLREGKEYRIVAIPASHRLDLRKAREAFEASKRLRLASEGEMEADFQQFEVGAVPPLGSMVQAPEVIDPALLGHERVLCAGGDHRHSVLISPRDLARLADARVIQVCED
jgi:Ala-tRNA(Pro) deacylase